MRLQDLEAGKNERPGVGMMRIVQTQIEQACGLCQDVHSDPEVTVHEIRKTIKRIRSVIRLLRFSIGEEQFRRENDRLGSISLLLAELRRRAAHLEVLNLTLGRPELDLPVAARKNLDKFFSQKKSAVFQSLARENNALDHCLQQLSAYKTTWQDIPAGSITRKTLLAGYVRTYRSGRRRLTRAIQDPTMENNHDLRKAVKSLWNQTQVLRILWPAVFGAVIRALDRLGNCLGLDHDLAELDAVIRENTILRGNGLEQVLSAIDDQRKKSQQYAWQLARKIYAEKPSAFSGRMEVYFAMCWKGTGVHKDE